VASFDKRATLTPTQPSSHFPELSDQNGAHVCSHGVLSGATGLTLAKWTVNSARGGTSRPLASRPRKVTAQNFAQNLRWAKQPAVDESLGGPSRHRSVSISHQRVLDATALSPAQTPPAVERMPRRSIVSLVGGQPVIRRVDSWLIAILVDVTESCRDGTFRAQLEPEGVLPSASNRQRGTPGFRVPGRQADGLKCLFHDT
jgi:hypothetical protein